MTLSRYSEKLLHDLDTGAIEPSDYDELAARLWMIETEAAATPPPLDRDALLDIVRSHVLPIGNDVTYSRGWEDARASIERDILDAQDALAATPPPPLDGLDPAEQERLRVEFFGLQTPTGDET